MSEEEYKSKILDIIRNGRQEVLYNKKGKTSNTILEIIENELDNFSYTEDTDITYLVNGFDVLVNILSKNISMQNACYNQLTEFHAIMVKLIHSKPEEFDMVARNKYNQLKYVLEKYENNMLRLNFENPVDFNPTNEEFIEYIIFKQKSINYVKNACELYPHLINQVDKSGVPIIYKVLDEYLESLNRYLSKTNLGPLDDLIYYDKVLDLMINNDNLSITDYDKIAMLKKISRFIKKKNYKSNRLKEKLSFFTNNIINAINGIPQENSLENLSYKYEVHEKFKPSHNLEAQTIYIKNKTIEKDSVTPKIYTFDGKDACEIDDGLSLKLEDGIYHLGVHIADPTSYIPINSILYDEAHKRTRTLYMGNSAIPMFPSILSTDLMGLNEGKKTYMMSYYFDIDARTGELIDFQIRNEVGTITKNLTYDYFDEILKSGVEDNEFLEYINNLVNLSTILKRTYDEENLYKQFHGDMAKKVSTSVVESAMIYTNYNVAKYFSDNNLPFIYRCHKINEKEKVELTDLQERLRLNGNEKNAIRDLEMIKNVYPRAYYSGINVGHDGLGIRYYSHSTSPLRRLSDNIVNLCIKKFYLDIYTEEDIKKYRKMIQTTAQNINNKRRSLDSYEIEYAKIKGIRLN